MRQQRAPRGRHLAGEALDRTEIAQIIMVRRTRFGLALFVVFSLTGPVAADDDFELLWSATLMGQFHAIDSPEDDICICYRRVHAASPVTDGSWGRSRTFRSYPQL